MPEPTITDDTAAIDKLLVSLREQLQAAGYERWFIYINDTKYHSVTAALSVKDAYQIGSCLTRDNDLHMATAFISSILDPFDQKACDKILAILPTLHHHQQEGT